MDMFNLENAVEEKKAGLPAYDDITEEYNRNHNPAVRFLLTELIIRRALADDKGLKKNLGKCVCNRRNEDGSTTWLLGLYNKETLSERDADEIIISDNIPINQMWVIDKYSELAKEFA